MERLTTKDSCEKREMICRFEDCNTTEEYCPDLNTNKCDCLQEALNRLGEYEDAEDKGLLPKLPCNKGDVIYDINHGSVIELTVIGFRFGRMSNEDDDTFQSDEWCVECKGVISASIPFSKFGETVFLTREQAEQALMDMEEQK